MPAVTLALIVDDSTLDRRKMATAVKTPGHDLVEAESGEAALAIPGEQGSDLILVDIVMPGIDSFGVPKAVRTKRRSLSIPVLVIAGADRDMASVARAIALGAMDLLPKNFEPVLFKARVSASLERKRLSLESQVMLHPGRTSCELPSCCTLEKSIER